MKKFKSNLLLIGAWVSPDVKALVKKVSKVKGQNVSEYLRSLILADLDKRGLFNEAFKKAVQA